jgi:hypothetical protein
MDLNAVQLAKLARSIIVRLESDSNTNDEWNKHFGTLPGMGPAGQMHNFGRNGVRTCQFVRNTIDVSCPVHVGLAILIRRTLRPGESEKNVLDTFHPRSPSKFERDDQTSQNHFDKMLKCVE